MHRFPDNSCQHESCADLMCPCYREGTEIRATNHWEMLIWFAQKDPDLMRQALAQHDPVDQIENDRLNLEIEALRAKLFRAALAVSNPDLDHVDRCVEVSIVVGSAEDWR